MPARGPYSHWQRWGVMVMTVVSAVSTIASATIINVAIPDIMGALGIEPVDAQWLSAGFLAAMTASMVLGLFDEGVWSAKSHVGIATGVCVVVSGRHAHF